MKKIRRSIYYFFPFQLFLVHFKRNQVLIFFWVLLFGLITKQVFFKLGAYSLFLAPEYFDNVNFWSFFVYGISIGSFITAFNISSYIVNGYYFPFIATLARPFFKYTINNFLIPLLFIIILIINSVGFQLENECLSIKDVIYNISGLISGIILFIIIALSYFFTTNKDIFRMFGLADKKIEPTKIAKPIRVILQNDLQWKKLNTPRENIGKWRVETYLSGFFKIRRARNTGHYSREMMQKVLRQNHSNAAMFAIGIIVIILVFGIFMDNKFFMIPAGASFLILCTLLIMFFGAIKSLFKEWSFIVILFVIFGFNFFIGKVFKDLNNTAYGLNYSIKQSGDNLENLSYFNSFDFHGDYKETIKILNNWKKKNIDPDNPEKLPKMVFINANGGGMKSMIWTFYSLAYLNKQLDDKLFKRTQLISGASGGMIGAAYFRELFLQEQLGNIDSCLNNNILTQLSKDILNPIVFSYSFNDWFLKIKKFKYNNFSYYKDRGYSFENKLNENTNHVLDKPLCYYKEFEQQSLIPMMIFTPTIINDGRTLIISSQNISYLLANDFNKKTDRPANVEFRKLYKQYGADSLRFLTALRMNSTFPYIAPIITMPGKPQLQIMDAGIRDNYGTSTSLKFLYVFQDWIKENTSGVIFLQITEEKAKVCKSKPVDIFQFTKPLGNVYSNIFNIQEIHNDQLVEFSGHWMNENIKFISLYLESKEDRISLSWHLTKKEKEQIVKSIYSPLNQGAILELKEELLQ